MYRLKSSVKSCLNNYLYGHAGDEVKLISCADEKVAIVQDMNGERFPCLMQNLTNDLTEINIEAVPVDTTAKHKTNNRAQVSRKKAAPINQKSLF